MAAKKKMKKFLRTFLSGAAPLTVGAAVKRVKLTQGKKRSKAKTYVVELERDEDGVWVVSVPALPGCLTQARSIGQARERIREAVSLFNVPSDAELLFVVKGPQQAGVERLRAARAAAEEATQKANKATQKLAAELVEKGLSLRDIGELLELSFQRVQQIVKEATPKDARPG